MDPGLNIVPVSFPQYELDFIQNKKTLFVSYIYLSDGSVVVVDLCVHRPPVFNNRFDVLFYVCQELTPEERNKISKVIISQMYITNPAEVPKFIADHNGIIIYENGKPKQNNRDNEYIDRYSSNNPGQPIIINNEESIIITSQPSQTQITGQVSDSTRVNQQSPVIQRRNDNSPMRAQSLAQIRFNDMQQSVSRSHSLNQQPLTNQTLEIPNDPNKNVQLSPVRQRRMESPLRSAPSLAQIRFNDMQNGNRAQSPVNRR